MSKAVGMYSETAAEKFGTVIWVDADGGEHEITCYDDPSKYKWPDARVVAPVVKYVRKGREGTEPRFEPHMRMRWER